MPPQGDIDASSLVASLLARLDARSCLDCVHPVRVAPRSLVGRLRRSDQQRQLAGNDTQRAHARVRTVARPCRTVGRRRRRRLVSHQPTPVLLIRGRGRCRIRRHPGPTVPHCASRRRRHNSAADSLPDRWADESQPAVRQRHGERHHRPVHCREGRSLRRELRQR